MTVFDETMVPMNLIDERDVSSGIDLIYSNGYRVEIRYDDMSDSPRDWDNLGKMYYWHRNYILGDKSVDIDYYSDFQEFVDDLTEDWGEIIWLPLYLYDHSGITMSTSSQRFKMMDSQGWDWGCCGIIFASHDDIKKAFMVDEITEEVLDKATECLIGEVKTFDQYITGDVYYMNLYDHNDDILEGFGGVFGHDYAREEAESMAISHWNRFLANTPVQGVLPLGV